MRRREFIKVSGLAGLAFLIGCPSNVSQAALLALVNEIAVAWAKLSPFLSLNPALVASITAEIAAIRAAIQAWSPGFSITDIEKVVNALVATMALIPVIAMYEPLVALIVATAEGILALLVPGGAPNVMVTARGKIFGNPPHSAGQFKSAWNKAVKAGSLPGQLEL